jgi:hypothetical protein
LAQELHGTNRWFGRRSQSGQPIFSSQCSDHLDQRREVRSLTRLKVLDRAQAEVRYPGQFLLREFGPDPAIPQASA